MNLENLLKINFDASIKVKKQTLDYCKDNIIKAGKLLLKTLSQGNKILICGNGGSAADAQHFAAELVMRYETDRIGLPAISLSADSSILTAISNDDDFTNVFSRQIESLGQKNDLLIGISTSGNSQNVLNAIKTARTKSMNIMFLSGKNGGIIKGQLRDSEVAVIVPDNKTARIQETHILIIHTLCNMADLKFKR